MSNKPNDPSTASDRPRLKKETLRGLGFAELEDVRGGAPGGVHVPHGGHGKPAATRNCLDP